MKKIICLLLVAIMCVSLVACSSSSTKLLFVTGGEQGTYYAYGGVIATTVNNTCENLTVTAQTSGGSKANILSINNGEANMAFVQNDVMSYAYTGTDLFSDQGAIKSFSVVAAMYPETCQIISTSNINSIEELKGKTVSVGDAGSGVEFNAKQILAAYGITFEDIKPTNMSFGDSADALKNGKIDAFFCTAGDPTTAIVDLATTNEINLLGIDDEHVALLQKDYPFYAARTIKAGTYNGIDTDVQTVAIKATIIVSNNLSEDAVYDLTKAIFENKDSITHDKASFIDTEYATSDLGGVPLHAGAAKYYAEIGVNVD